MSTTEINRPMISLKLTFPIGLTARLVEALKPVALREKNTVFLGVIDGWEEVLAACEITTYEILK